MFDVCVYVCVSVPLKLHVKQFHFCVGYLYKNEKIHICKFKSVTLEHGKCFCLPLVWQIEWNKMKFKHKKKKTQNLLRNLIYFYSRRCKINNSTIIICSYRCPTNTVTTITILYIALQFFFSAEILLIKLAKFSMDYSTGYYIYTTYWFCQSPFEKFTFCQIFTFIFSVYGF